MSKKNRNRNRGRDESSGAGTATTTTADANVAQPPPADAAAAGGAPDTGDDEDDEPEISVSTGNGESNGEVKGADTDTAAATATATAAVTETKTATVAAEIVEALAERLKAGRCVLCAGNGFESAAAGMASYRALITQMLDAVGDSPEVRDAREVLERRPFVTAGFVRRHLGDRFVDILRDGSHAPAELPPAILTLGQLPFRAILSTSYSDLLTRAFTKDGAAPPVFTPKDAEELKHASRKRFILKALGDPSRPDTVIWTSQEIQLALASEEYRGLVHDLYRNRSILFLGFSAADIEMFFGRLFAGAHTESLHYAVLPGLSRVEAEDLEAAFHIKALDVDMTGLVAALREALGDFDADAPPDDDDIEGWLGVLAQEPGRADALDKLAAIERRAREAKSHERLMELHLGFIEVEPQASERARRLREVAQILETEVGDLARAFTALVAAYKEDPEQDLAGELERLAGAAGMWSELLAEYTAIAPQLKQELRAPHWTRVARLYGEKLGHAEYALTSVEEALKADPFHREALELKIDLLRKGEKWKELTTALGTRAENEVDTAKRFELYLEQADLFETRLSDGPAAAKAYRGALSAEPGNAEALGALEHLHRRRGEFQPLLAVLDEKIQHLPRDRAVELRKEAAALAADKLADRKAAIERYETLRHDGDADLGVLKALEALYDAEGRTADYLDVLAAQVDLVKEDKDKVALYRRLAAEWEEQPNGAGRAADYLEKLLAIDARNEEALRGLEKLYALEQKWEALVDTYRRHAELPGGDKVTLNGYIGQVFENQVNDPQRAIEAWSRVAELMPSSEQALEALARLYQRTEAWQRAVEALDKRAEVAKEKEVRVALLHEAGRLAVEKLGDPKGGEARYAKALGVDHAHVPSMTAMVELYRKSGECLRAAKLLTEAETHTTNRLEKTRLLVEAGELYAALEEPKTAIDLYLKALAVDPEHVEAGGRVADLLWKAERWADIVPVLEMLTRKDADKETQKVRWSRLGRAAGKLGQNEKAAKAYAKAAEIDPTDLEAQRARGALLFDEQKWMEAREALQAVLHYHRDDLAPTELVDLFFHLGECDRKLGHVDKAKNFYAKALEIDATHRPTILAQIDVGGGTPQEIIDNKKKLLATASDDEKVKLLTEIGELYLDKLEDPPQAVGAYREALALKPDSRVLMHRCLDVYVQQKDWKQALEMLEKLTDAEPTQSVRAKLKYARAQIHRDELSENEPAVKLLTEALDDEWTATPAAKDLEELLEKTEQWKELQRLYRKIIKRLPAEATADTPEQRKDRLRLWDRVAQLSLEKLEERETGLAALEVALAFEPNDLKRHEQLAQLYVEAGPDKAEKAIAEHQTLLRAQHDRVASLRALRQLYPQVRQQEKALAVAYALSLLKKGDPDDVELVKEAKTRPLQPARRNLDDDAWTRWVAHPDEDRAVDALFAQIAPMLAASNGRPHKDLGINRKEKVENTDGRAFMKGTRYIAGALDVKLPYECYVRYEQRDAIAIANCVDKQTAIPCMLFGAPMLGDKRPERELIYELTKRLAYFRNERYLRFVLPQPAQLAQVLDGAIALGAEVSGKGGGTGEVQKKAQELKRALPPKTLEQVVFFAKKLVGQRGDQLAAAWLAATELTATRAAFLLMGDLEQTARMVAAEPPAVSTLPATHRLKELIWFSVTEECFSAKKHLGLMP